MEQIMALYQAVHSFTNQKNTDDLVKLLINYTKTITKAENVLFKNFMEERAGTLLSNHCIEESIKEKINQNIEEKWDNKKNNEKIYELNFGYNQYIMIEVKSTYKTYGVLGIETKVNKNNFHYTQIIDQLIFLSELSAIVLERVHLEEINERLLITQEQNRIASEIHDTVLQRLFSMSCGIFALTKNINDLENKQIIEELNQIRNTTDGIMKSLRATIYDLSWEKNSNAFLENINKYILEIEKMCNVNIKLKVNGNQHRLSARHKKAIYRIICEGIGNATRHGKSTHIDVTLKMKTNLVILEITDNGVGFDVKQIIRNSKKGLGIRNLYHLTESLNGVINLQSKIDKGTLIKIDIPLETLSVKEEAG